MFKSSPYNAEQQPLPTTNTNNEPSAAARCAVSVCGVMRRKYGSMTVLTAHAFAAGLCSLARSKAMAGPQHVLYLPY